MHQLILFVAITLATSTLVEAQSSLSGVVSDKNTRVKLVAVTIIIRNKQTNEISKRVTTNNAGAYRITDLKFGKYILESSAVGYLPLKVDNISTDALHSDLKVNVEMDPIQTKLTEVVVTAKKQLFTNSIDRKVYNVDQDVMSKSGTASEVLQNVPLVQVDIEGNVSLRNSNVTILINGRKNPLMGKNQAAVLQQLPANSIERIEVITNPSARYKPEGQGGIINIVLKKNTKLGLNGNIAVNGGNDERYNASAFLNYNPKKFNVFGSYSIRQDDRHRSSYNIRNQQSPFVYTSDSLTALTRPFANIASAGVDFKPDEKNTFGVSGNYYLRSQKKNDVTAKIIALNNQNKKYNRILSNNETELESDATAYFEHGFKKEDHLLRLEMNVSHSPETENNHFTNRYKFPVRADSLDNTIIKQISDNKQITLSYENPINDETKFELGYEGEFNKQDLDFFGEAYDIAQAKFLTDVTKTNRFVYNENIHAIYGTFSHSFGVFGFVGGLRAEHSDIKSKLISAGSTIPSLYFKVYPSLHLSYKLSKSRELQLNYSKRVNRPEGDDLNPFAEYKDPTNIKVGNPYLKPELIHSVELGYQWKNDKISILPGFYYRYKYNGFTSISAPSPDNSSILITTLQNLSNDQAVGADVVVSGNVSSWVSSNFTANLFYNQIDASNLGYSDKRSTINWSANFNSIITLRSSTILQVSSNYRSNRLTPQGKTLPSYVMNMGLRQEVLNKRGSIYFTASDIFKTLRQERDLDTSTLQIHSKTVSNSRILYLGFAYNFGKSLKKKKDNLQFDNSL